VAAPGAVVRERGANANGVFVGILVRETAVLAIAFAIFLRFLQVIGLADGLRTSGQGRGRTADLPLQDCGSPYRTGHGGLFACSGACDGCRWTSVYVDV